MTDTNITPSLTLEPESGAALEDTPTLTLEPEAAAETQAAKPEVKPVELNDDSLSEAERKVVNDFAEKIDITNSTVVLQYGAGTQKKVADFSGAALNNIRTSDLGEVGEMVGSLVVELKGFDASSEQKKGFFGLFQKAADQIESFKARFAKAETNVDKVEGMLEQHQVTLLKDIAMFDKMYTMNLTYFKELTMYILAGKKKLAEARATQLPKLIEKAKQTNLPEDAQAARDFENMCTRFEKKLYDLELTRNISVQMAPQIRLLQNNDTMMAEKIQTSIVNTIPLWKSQMVLALGLAHSQQAIEAQQAVSEMTNALLRKNAETLKQGTIAAAKESERGIVDIETLQATNRSLIETLDEVVKIQKDGKEKRAAAEVELGRIEGELKAKLLEINT